MLVIDSKHELGPKQNKDKAKEWPGFYVTKSVRDALSLDHAHVIFRPENRGQINEIFDRCYDQGGWNIVVDEVRAILKNDNPLSAPPAFTQKDLTRGRSRLLTLWNGTQRPAKVPKEVFSEAMHFFIWHLSLWDDLRRVAEMTVPEIIPAIQSLKTLDRHAFVYYNRLNGTLVISKPLSKEWVD